MKKECLLRLLQRVALLPLAASLRLFALLHLVAAARRRGGVSAIGRRGESLAARSERKEKKRKTDEFAPDASD